MSRSGLSVRRQVVGGHGNFNVIRAALMVGSFMYIFISDFLA